MDRYNPVMLPQESIRNFIFRVEHDLIAFDPLGKADAESRVRALKRILQRVVPPNLVSTAMRIGRERTEVIQELQEVWEDGGFPNSAATRVPPPQAQVAAATPSRGGAGGRRGRGRGAPGKTTDAQKGGTDPEVVCHHCGGKGHVLRHCPSREPSTCYACGGKGHFARECPSRKNEGGHRTRGRGRGRAPPQAAATMTSSTGDGGAGGKSSNAKE